ncbi:hypothetical protein G3N95_18365 [Paraburkholderia sp. Tr-20389]|uniref:hypothetical protein n=1 Tax=Paraburkholderia sp. Tr-20389 TaxID=2703903 RepID=UPI001981D3DD|nr:hypothetical protein [Paraburkholderia sp. Tr-20389]MBN3754917.1 hypothetical protein [Paraburkholderia sp. Tr-20389]
MKAGVDRSFRNDTDDADSRRSAAVPSPSTRLALVPHLLILGVCGWSLIETSAEFDPSAGEVGIAALAFAKIVWTVIGIAAACGIRRAQWIFSFLCGLSLVAIVPGLPVELNGSAWIFAQSLVECVLKAGALLALGLSRVTRPAAIGYVAWNDDNGRTQKP